jgi:hypothetical protein
VLEHRRIDVHLAAQQGPQRGQGAQLVAGEVAAKLLLAGQAGLVVAQRLAGQVQVQPTGGWDDRQRIAGPGADRQRLEDLAGVDAQRSGLVGGGVGLAVGEQLEGAAPLLQVLGDGRHDMPPPRPRAGGGHLDAFGAWPRGGCGYRTRRLMMPEDIPADAD